MLGMPLAVALAWVFPDIGAKGGLLRTEITTKLAVAFVFFSQGLTLPAKALKDGASQWQLHLAVQLFGFLIVPLIGLGFDAVVGAQLAPDLRLGFLFLCVLPSTIVMAVALATVAGGNVPAAIFNAVLSNVLGVFVTPMWVAWLMKSSGQTLSLVDVLQELFFLLLLPLAVGQIVRRFGAEIWADANRKRLNNAANAIILVIVYAAFCNSVKADLWSSHGWKTFVAAAVGVMVLQLVAVGGAVLLARVFRFAPAEAIVFTITGAQKSLATGVPLAKVIFGAHPGLGLILLPIMIYHPSQLFLCGTLAGRHLRKHGVTDR
ncbi:bile acid:sodium symporter family protein [Actomonas aquatica]|uniref:Bile acid:sodium symporter family protein n=1 Tax=Actomonas aquatica TaxID=2866162 RepID=A0ABZ1C8P5_9BACT|nr:bile acid:sodium symporter family protein [Opitutus sp. WL0086]WRQ87826.1 bile acid:sodium symporter family protein [Opitutus sp. WL0086]